jgi:hypothetical protein
VAIGFRLLALNVAIGLQITEAQQRPETIRTPGTLWVSFRAKKYVNGLGSLVLLRPRHSDGEQRYHLPWTQHVVHVAA